MCLLLLLIQLFISIFIFLIFLLVLLDGYWHFFARSTRRVLAFVAYFATKIFLNKQRYGRVPVPRLIDTGTLSTSRWNEFACRKYLLIPVPSDACRRNEGKKIKTGIFSIGTDARIKMPGYIGAGAGAGTGSLIAVLDTT